MVHIKHQSKNSLQINRWTRTGAGVEAGAKDLDGKGSGEILNSLKLKLALLLEPQRPVRIGWFWHVESNSANSGHLFPVFFFGTDTARANGMALDSVTGDLPISINGTFQRPDCLRSRTRRGTWWGFQFSGTFKTALPCWKNSKELKTASWTLDPTNAWIQRV